MASLRAIKLLSTFREQSCCLCLQRKHQYRLQLGRDRHAPDRSHQPSSWVGIFWFWISMDSMEQICASKDKREIRYYIQTKGRNASFFLQIIFLLCQGGADRGIRDMDWKGKGSLNICAYLGIHRDGNTWPLSQHIIPVCYSFGCSCSQAIAKRKWALLLFWPRKLIHGFRSPMWNQCEMSTVQDSSWSHTLLFA